MSPVLEYIFSHAQVSKKNVLVTMLIVRLSSGISRFVRNAHSGKVQLCFYVGPVVWKGSHPSRRAYGHSQ